LLWGDEFAWLRERILATKDAAHRFALVENFLLDKFISGFILNPCVEYALRAIVGQPEQTSLRELTERIGYSQKHFIGMFKRQVGLTPKRYLKIMRFQKAVQEIERQPALDWTLLAADCGFYDQAHFINDFKLFSGFTPEDYLNRKNDTLNYIPVG
jgi:methylphosphotriester-DNA--protein-cysteine methyltransferase